MIFYEKEMRKRLIERRKKNIIGEDKEKECQLVEIRNREERI